jgi:hypothetical protein
MSSGEDPHRATSDATDGQAAIATGRRDLAEASGFKKGSQHKKQLKWEEASTSSLSP